MTVTLAKNYEKENPLDAARDQLSAAEAAVIGIAADENAAIGSPQRYSAWLAKKAAAEGELERLTKLVSVRELESEEFAQNAAEADLRSRYKKKLKSNEELAQRLRDGLTEINRIAVPLLREVTISALEDRSINNSLPADLAPLVSAEFQARGRSPLRRQELSRKKVLLWVREDGAQNIVGDQGQVEDRGEGRGRLTSGVSVFSCIKMLFEEIEYHPEEQVERPQPMSGMRLPNPAGPNFIFDGTIYETPAAALAALERLEAAPSVRSRRVEKKLVRLPLTELARSESDEEA